MQKKSSYVLLLLVFMVVIAIGIYFYQQSKKPLDVNSDLKSLSLDQNDVKGLQLLYESRFDRDTINPNAHSRYIISYDNSLEFKNKKEKYKSVTDKIFIYNSTADLEKDFVKKKPEPIFEEVTITQIGDGSYAFKMSVFGQKNSYIRFRKKNVIVEVSLNGGDINEAIAYAKILDGKI